MEFEENNLIQTDNLIVSSQHGTSSSSLLYEIVAMEEDRDLQAVAVCILSRVCSKRDEKWTWTPQTEDKLCTYLEQEEKNLVVLFPTSEGMVEISDCVPTSVTWFWVIYKDNASRITAANFDEVLFQAYVDPNDANTVIRKFAENFAKSFHGSNQNEGLKHLLLTKLREMILSVCEKYRTEIILPDEYITGDFTEIANNSCLVNRLESVCGQWIDVLYNRLNLSDEDMNRLNNIVGIESEIAFWEERYKMLAKTQQALEQGRNTMKVLEAAGSIYWMQLHSQMTDLDQNLREIRLNLKLLNTLSRNMTKLRTCKIEDIPPVYDEVLDRLFVIGKYAPGYTSNDALSRLLFQLGEELITICKKSLSPKKPFQGKVNQCNESLILVTRCIEYCTSLYYQTVTLLRRQRYPNLPSDHNLTLANLQAFQIRLGHLKEICICQQQLGRLNDGKRTKLPILDYERQSDVQLAINECDEIYAKRIEELSCFQDELLDVYSTVWPEKYEKFLSDVEQLEVKLIDALEQGLERSKTLIEKVEIFFFFKHLYERPNVSEAMDRLSLELYNFAKNEVKTACREQKHLTLTPDKLNQPRDAGKAMSIQRIRGYLEKIALVMQRLDWLGAEEERAAVLSRIKKWRQVLSDGIKEDFFKWSGSGIDTTSKILESAVLSRHVCKPELLQPNLDRTVFHVVQSASYWDRLLLEIPQDVQFVWQTRGELRVVHQSVLSLAVQYNMLIKDLKPERQVLFGTCLKKVFTTVNPGLSQITWNQPQLVKKYVNGCLGVLSEIEELLNNCKLVDKGVTKICEDLKSRPLVSFTSLKAQNYRLVTKDVENEIKSSSAELVEQPLETLVPLLETLHGKVEWQNHDAKAQWQTWLDTLDSQIVEAWEENISRCVRSLCDIIDPETEDEDQFVVLFYLKVMPQNSKLVLQPSFREIQEVVLSVIERLFTLNCPVLRTKTYLLTSPRFTPRSARSDTKAVLDDASLTLSKTMAEVYDTAVERVKLGIRRLAYEVKGCLRMWIPWKTLWSVEVNVLFQAYMDQKPDIQTVTSDFLNHEAVTSRSEDFEPAIRCGCLSLDFSALKTLASDNSEIWELKFMSYLKELLDAEHNYEEAYAITLIENLRTLARPELESYIVAIRRSVFGNLGK